MAVPKEKLPKFDEDGMNDPIHHCKTCETIWTAHGVTDQDDWLRQFLATLRGIAIDWFTDADPTQINSWPNLKKEFIAEFRLLRDDNKIVADIYSTKQGKNETVRGYAKRLKELVGKMERRTKEMMICRRAMTNPQEENENSTAILLHGSVQPCTGLRK